MKRLLCLSLCLVLAFTAVACKKESVKTHTPNTTQAAEPTEPVKYQYVPNPLINRFLTELVAKYGKTVFDPNSITRGIITADTPEDERTNEYSVNIAGLRVTLRDVSKELNGLRFMIEGGYDKKSYDTMMNVFSKIVYTVDAGVTKERMEGALAFYKSKSGVGPSDDPRFFNYIRVESYISYKNGGNVPCCINLMAINYMV